MGVPCFLENNVLECTVLITFNFDDIAGATAAVLLLLPLPLPPGPDAAK